MCRRQILGPLSLHSHVSPFLHNKHISACVRERSKSQEACASLVLFLWKTGGYSGITVPWVPSYRRLGERERGACKSGGREDRQYT